MGEERWQVEVEPREVDFEGREGVVWPEREVVGSDKEMCPPKMLCLSVESV